MIERWDEVSERIRDLETEEFVIVSDTLANLNADYPPGIEPRFAYVVATQLIYYDDGVAWQALSVGGPGPAPVDAQYILMALNPTLTDERVLTAGEALTLTDGGAGGAATLDVNIGDGVTYDAANDEIDLGTPSDVTSVTANTVGAATHTHALDNTGVAAAVYGSATQVGQFTVDAKGRLTNAANVAIAGVPPAAHDILSASHGDTNANAVTRGSLIYGNATPAWDELNHPAAATRILTTDANDVLWSTYNLTGTAGQTYTLPTTGGTIPTAAGTLDTTTANNITAAGVITHAITTTSDGDTNVSTILASSAVGGLRLDRLGIGLAEVAGGINLENTSSSTTGIVFKNGDRFAHNFQHPTGNTAVPDGFNTFFGVSAGNLTMGSTAASTDHASYNVGVGYQTLLSNTTGYKNTAIGYEALNSNTTGQYNTAIGNEALYSNTDGYRNTASGYQALYSNTSGHRNTASGHQALYSNTADYNTASGYAALYNTTTGDYNTASGTYALSSNIDGYQNTADGYEAGRYINAGGDNETSDSSVYIGYDTRASADGNTNEIVIGASGRGNGSNTVTLGNTSITDSYLFGDVQIETGLGIVHADGVAAGDVLRADGTRYIPATLSMDDLGSTSLADPGADRIVFWDDSDNEFEFLVANDGIEISGNNLNLTTPGTLTAATGNTAAGSHTHAITTTSDGAANHSTILASSGAGALRVDDLYVPDGGFVGISGADGWTFDSTNGDISTTSAVGIGTAGPSELLHVSGGNLRLQNDGDTYYQVTNHLSGWTHGMDSGSSSYKFKFGVASPSDRVTITNVGDVGINETDPDYKLDVGGDANVTGVYRVDDDQVVTNRQTGWGAPTGTATRTTFATSTVTLEELAERVHALIDDLTTHGLIGA